MFIFDIGIKILLTLTIFFFLIFFFLCRAWDTAHPEKRTLIGFLVSFLYTFLVFLAGLLLLIIIALVWHYLSNLFQQIP